MHSPSDRMSSSAGPGRMVSLVIFQWNGTTQLLFRERYEHGQPCDSDESSRTRVNQHPHVHGANLGFRASAYLRAGGFPALPTAEDHALVAAHGE